MAKCTDLLRQCCLAFVAYWENMFDSRLYSLSLAALLAAGCGEKNSEVTDGSVCTEVRKDIPVAINRDLDLLLVVDNSLSMTDEASALAAALQSFANVLENIEGGLPNIQIAVVSGGGDASSLGQFVTQAELTACLDTGDGFLVDKVFANGEREKNYSASLGDTLVCMAALPPSGQRIEQPLEAMRRALDGTHTESAGFLRESAFLFVVLLGDEDDCSGGGALGTGTGETNSAWQCFADSAQCDQSVDTIGAKTGCEVAETPTTLTAVSAYVDFLRGTKADPGQVWN